MGKHLFETKFNLPLICLFWSDKRLLNEMGGQMW